MMASLDMSLFLGRNVSQKTDRWEGGPAYRESGSERTPATFRLPVSAE